MKAIKIIFSLLIALLLTTNVLEAQDRDQIKKMLQDKDQQQMIMQTIADDDEMMMNMMRHMRQSDHAMQMMRSNKRMMKQLMQGEHMTRLMKEEPDLARINMRHMMMAMEQDKATNRNIRELMLGHAHMNSQMMDMCKQQGMQMGPGMMQDKSMQQEKAMKRDQKQIHKQNPRQ